MNLTYVPTAVVVDGFIVGNFDFSPSAVMAGIGLASLTTGKVLQWSETKRVPTLYSKGDENDHSPWKIGFTQRTDL